jgi:hypothetical protein
MSFGSSQSSPTIADPAGGWIDEHPGPHTNPAQRSGRPEPQSAKMMWLQARHNAAGPCQIPSYCEDGSLKPRTCHRYIQHMCRCSVPQAYRVE